MRVAPGSSLAGCGDRVVINMFGDPACIGRLLGPDIELPDPDNANPDYWRRIHADGGYKRRIADAWWARDAD